MSHHQSIDKAGTPATRHLFAVFDRLEEAGAAQQELTAMGLQADLVNNVDVAPLHNGPEDQGHLIDKAMRFLKGLGGEDLEAKRYAIHLQNGRAVLTMPCDTQESADELTAILSRHGGYDVTFFGNWTIQHMSPGENAQHGMPTYEASTGTDDYATGEVTSADSYKS